MRAATAIVPVKRFSAAKQRLLDELDRRERAAVVGSMLDDVLVAVLEAERIERVVIVTGERRAERIALERSKTATTSLEVLQDPKDRGHSEAATLGIVRAKALGARCVALLPGDCPLLDPEELDGAVERERDGRVAVVPDRHGTGTNALLMAPPDAIGPAFGPDSCSRHADRARRAGYEVAIEPLDSLGLDLDTPADLADLTSALERESAQAPSTAAALERAGRLPRGASG